MNFNVYQEIAHEHSRYPRVGSFFYPVLGLCSEAGEVADRFKKAFFEKGIFHWAEVPTDDPNCIYTREGIVSELGDVLWYLAEIATQLNVNLSDIANANIDKIQGRNP